MKRYLAVLFCAIINSVTFGETSPQLIETIYTIDADKTLHICNDSIQSNPGNFENVTPYIPVATIDFSAQNNPYQVRLYRYNGWEKEAGDFEVFSLFNGNDQILEFIDFNSWIKIKDDFQPLSSSPNNYFLVFEMDNGITMLILNGQGYTNQPPRLTFIAIQNGSAQVVYNPDEKYLINSITPKEGGYFDLELHDAVLTGDPDFLPNVYTLKATASGMYIYK